MTQSYYDGWKPVANDLGIESFRFGPYTADSLGVVMVKKDIQSPEIRLRTVELPNRPGVINLGVNNPLSRFGSREIEVTVDAVIPKMSKEEVPKRMLYKLLSLEGEQQLIFNGTPDRLFKATVSGIEFETMLEYSATLNIVRSTITFFCSQPWAYDLSGDIVVNDLSAALDNEDGDAPADTLYTLTMEQNTINTTFRVGSSRLVIPERLASGDEIQIYEGQIIKNGSNFIVADVSQSKDFLQIPIGTYHFSCSAKCSGSIKFKRRYLSL